MCHNCGQIGSTALPPQVAVVHQGSKRVSAEMPCIDEEQDGSL